MKQVKEEIYKLQDAARFNAEKEMDERIRRQYLAQYNVLAQLLTNLKN